MRLNRKFFNRPTVTVAKELLGNYLVRKIGRKVVRLKIAEVEAYCGRKDKACHASKGLTPRTKIMFGPPGHAYVYLIYGMYNCLNIVTKEEGCPEAVLIRGVEGINGPGRVCRELKIDRKLNGVDMIKGKHLWVEKGERPATVKKSKRIGVDYAGTWADKLWRFHI